jgi:PST family polysaccharide transporter
MNNLFIYQMIGDFFKIAGWLLAFNMLARSMTKIFIATEILFPSLYVLNSYLLVDYGGTVVGVTQAYLINKVLYFIVMIIIFRKVIWIK